MEKRIAEEIKNIKESFTYLFVLKDVPLMDAQQKSEIKYARCLKIFEDIWENRLLPDGEQILSDLSEDYQELKENHKADAILSRIHRALNVIFEELIRLRESGMNFEDARKILA